jgi:hypothetical protein
MVAGANAGALQGGGGGGKRSYECLQVGIYFLHIIVSL